MRTVDGAIHSEETEVRTRWALLLINCEVLSVDEVRTVVGELNDGKATGVCGIYAEMLTAAGEPILKGLYTLLCFVWYSGVIPAG